MSYISAVNQSCGDSAEGQSHITEKQSYKIWEEFFTTLTFPSQVGHTSQEILQHLGFEQQQSDNNPGHWLKCVRYNVLDTVTTSEDILLEKCLGCNISEKLLSNSIPINYNRVSSYLQ